MSSTIQLESGHCQGIKDRLGSKETLHEEPTINEWLNKIDAARAGERNARESAKRESSHARGKASKKKDEVSEQLVHGTPSVSNPGKPRGDPGGGSPVVAPKEGPNPNGSAKRVTVGDCTQKYNQEIA